MGNTTTKQLDTAIQEYQKPLELINKAVDAYTSYDLDATLQILERSHGAKFTPELKQLIQRQHQYFNEFTSKDKKGDLNDINIMDIYTKNIMNADPKFTDIKARRDKMLAHSMIKQLDSKGQITRMLDGLAHTYGKYKFFEFKYVQMNLFMILLSEEMAAFFAKVVAQTTGAIASVGANLNKDFADLLTSLENLSDKPESNQKYQNLAEGTRKALSKTHGELSRVVESLKKNNVGLGELFTMLIKKDQEMFQAAKRSLIEAEAEMKEEEQKVKRQQPQQPSGLMFGAPQIVPPQIVPQFGQGMGRRQSKKHRIIRSQRKSYKSTNYTPA